MTTRTDLISVVLVFTITLPSAILAPVANQLTPDRQLQQLATASKVDTLQEQLLKFQADLEKLKGGNVIQSHMEKQPESATQASAVEESKFGRPSESLGTWGRYVAKSKPPLDGVFYDRPVDLSKRLYERRQIGLQPFRRGLSEPQVQLSWAEGADLRQEVINAVEEHLLRDLEAAKSYGIRPEEILQDLRQKQSDQT